MYISVHGRSNCPEVGRPVRRMTSVTQNEADEVTRARTRMVVVEMGRERHFLPPQLKLERCNHGFTPNGAKCMTDGGDHPVMKSIILAPRTDAGLSGRGSGWYGAVTAVRATVIK